MSYPRSAIAATARGLTRVAGRDPALSAISNPAPCMRAKPSAIWLRLEFSRQTNSTRGRAGPWPLVCGSYPLPLRYPMDGRDEVISEPADEVELLERKRRASLGR